MKLYLILSFLLLSIHVAKADETAPADIKSLMGAAAKCNQEAQFQLSELYAEGAAVEQNDTEAMFWALVSDVNASGSNLYRTHRKTEMIAQKKGFGPIYGVMQLVDAWLLVHGRECNDAMREKYMGAAEKSLIAGIHPLDPPTTVHDDKSPCLGNTKEIFRGQMGGTTIHWCTDGDQKITWIDMHYKSAYMPEGMCKERHPQ